MRGSGRACPPWPSLANTTLPATDALLGDEVERGWDDDTEQDDETDAHGPFLSCSDAEHVGMALV
jgi:hypothetical protein